MKKKHIVITGGGRGIGRGLSLEFMKAGCRVSINGRTRETIDNAVNELGGEYGDTGIFGFPCDVTDMESLEDFCSRAVSAFGDIDIWINNAGINQPRLNFWEMKGADYAPVFRTNIDGAVNGSIVAARQMLKQGYGKIFNMEGFGSDGRKTPQLSIYGTSKRAVSYFTESFNLELKSSGVSAALLSPGMVMTDFLRNGLPEDPEMRERTKKVYNILADEVSDVTSYLVREILADNGGRKKIAWLTTGKILKRFLLSPLSRRNFFA